MLHSLNYSSPLGPIVVTSNDSALLSLVFAENFTLEQDYIPEILNDAAKWLDRYFSGEDPGCPPSLDPHGTEFQKRIWNELLNVKWNEQITYGELARRSGTHPRAAGQAVGHNPLPLFIPCHRIVAAHGLGGYTPGIEIKKKLLLLESGGNNTLDFTV